MKTTSEEVVKSIDRKIEIRKKVIEKVQNEIGELEDIRKNILQPVTVKEVAYN